MKLKNYTKRFYRPEFLVTLIIIYFFFSGISYIFLSKYDFSLSPLIIIVIGTGLFGYLLGLKYSRYIYKTKFLPIIIGVIITSLFTLNVFGMNIIYSISFGCLVLLGFFILLKIKGKWFMTAIGFILLLFNFLIFGIPLLDMSLHYRFLVSFSPLLLIGFYLSLYSLVKKFPEKDKINIVRVLFSILVVFSVLSTFRSLIFISLGSWFLLEMKRKRKGMSVILIVVFSLVFLGLGGFLMQENMGQSFGVLENVGYRLGFTTTVFSDITTESFPFGETYGETLTTIGGKKISQTIYNYDAQLTSTIFGEPMMDFGLIGVFVIMLFIGGLLKELYKKDFGIFVIIFTHIITSIELSINGPMLMFIIYLGYTRILLWKKSERRA